MLLFIWWNSLTLASCEDAAGFRVNRRSGEEVYLRSSHSEHHAAIQLFFTSLHTLAAYKAGSPIMSRIFPGCRTIMDLATKHDIPLYIAAHTCLDRHGLCFSLSTLKKMSAQNTHVFFSFKLGGGLIYLVPSGQTCLWFYERVLPVRGEKSFRAPRRAVFSRLCAVIQRIVKHFSNCDLGKFSSNGVYWGTSSHTRLAGKNLSVWPFVAFIGRYNDNWWFNAVIHCARISDFQHGKVQMEKSI